MTNVLYIGQAPETVDYSDPALPPGANVETIKAGIDLAVAAMADRGWNPYPCMITPDDEGIAALGRELAARS
jgi:hypothetical protein